MWTLILSLLRPVELWLWGQTHWTWAENETWLDNNKGKTWISSNHEALSLLMDWLLGLKELISETSFYLCLKDVGFGMPHPTQYQQSCIPSSWHTAAVERHNEAHAGMAPVNPGGGIRWGLVMTLGIPPVVHPSLKKPGLPSNNNGHWTCFADPLWGIWNL